MTNATATMLFAAAVVLTAIVIGPICWLLGGLHAESRGDRNGAAEARNPAGRHVRPPSVSPSPLLRAAIRDAAPPVYVAPRPRLWAELCRDIATAHRRAVREVRIFAAIRTWEIRQTFRRTAAPQI